MVTKEQVKCDYCGKDETDLFRQIGEHRIVECRYCGLIYVNPRITREELDKLYLEEYFITHNIQIKDAEQLAWSRLRRRLRIIERFMPDKGRFLEIGCASGYFLSLAKKSGWDVEGIEYSSFSAERARQMLSIDVKIGEFKEGVFPPDTYNVVFMSHVLEHCFEPKGVLAEIYRLLKKNGIVVIEVPNIEAYDLRFHGEKWKGWQLPYHLYFFSKKTLMQYLESLDFQIAFTTTIGCHVLMRKGKKNPFYKIAYYFNRFFKVVEGRNLFMIARRKHRVV